MFNKSKFLYLRPLNRLYRSFYEGNYSKNNIKIRNSSYDFSKRHIGPSNNETRKMLKQINVENFDKLVYNSNPNITPHNVIHRKSYSEHESIKNLESIMSKNIPNKSFIGMGYHNSILPSPIKRHILMNPKWYTAYTPYQAEISQGRLESQFNYQTMIKELTGLDVSNASLLDEGSTISETINIFHNYYKKKRNIVICSSNLHPQIIDIIKTKCSVLDLELKFINFNDIDKEYTLNYIEDYNESIMGIIFSYPDTYGEIYIPYDIINLAQEKNILTCSNNDILSLVKIKSPGDLGIDISFGTSQRFGIPMWYGGPHPSFLAVNKKLLRLMPGRIIGESTDTMGQKAYRLGLQTREQHIRRDKATSNICTSQSLLANVAAFYSIYHGRNGLKEIYDNIHNLTAYLHINLKNMGFSIKNENYFDTLTINVDNSRYYDNGKNNNILFRKINNDLISISLDETTLEEDCDKILDIFSDKFSRNISYMYNLSFIERNTMNKNNNQKLNKTNYLRQSNFMEQDKFNNYHSETELMRYIFKLVDKDYTLTDGMIPLGSCTMKLNASSQLEPLLWNSVTNFHPYSPKSFVNGYSELIEETGNMLKEITGFNNISFQSNSGAMGEYSGLLCIRQYHIEKSNEDKIDNENIRNICLIPDSAHGTNFSSAKLAGMKIVTFKDDEFNNFEDLVKKYKDNLSCLIITYPNTSGLFQDNIKQICKIIHKYGGLVYMDGANMNAQVNLTSPAVCGADVCHLNIHKTFCIPHGGGGPGLGPILCNNKLKDYLPTNNIQISPKDKNDKSFGSITSSNWSSASLLTIPYMYISTMGSKNLQKATENAILNSNYLVQNLKDHFTIIDLNKNGFVGHEFIIDVSEFKHLNITENDIAKRLIDYSFHPPTMSWPRKGVLMFEPTESESLEELDRLINSMINIRNEIREIEEGIYDIDNNVLKNAPHSQKMISQWDSLNYPYNMEKAFFPIENLYERKHWPSVSRVDDVGGDKKLMCC